MDKVSTKCHGSVGRVMGGHRENVPEQREGRTGSESSLSGSG